MARIKKDRREFMQYSTLGILGLVLGAGVVTSPYLKAGDFKLRPPGAVNEEDFLALCIKCGQCLQVCPYHSIDLLGISNGHLIGTPYIDALERGCYLCTALPCVLACPSGALDHNTEKPEDVKMGIAVLHNENACIAVKKIKVSKQDITKTNDKTYSNEQEIQMYEKLEEFENENCTICADMCPYPDASSAIRMVDVKNGGQKPEILKACVGCGVCVELCPSSVLSIKKI